LFDTETGRLIDVPNLPAEVVAAISSVEITHNKDGEKVTKVRLCSKVEALDKLCRHLGMYEDKVQVLGLERELASLTDEEIEGRLIELRSRDYRRVDNPAPESSGAAAPVLTCCSGRREVKVCNPRAIVKGCRGDFAMVRAEFDPDKRTSHEDRQNQRSGCQAACCTLGPMRQPTQPGTCECAYQALYSASVISRGSSSSCMIGTNFQRGPGDSSRHTIRPVSSCRQSLSILP
jgi:hypothetical protein